MQILLASAKTMSDDTKLSSKINLSEPMFRLEAEILARDMFQYSVDSIAEMLKCSRMIASLNKLRFMDFFNDVEKTAAIFSYKGQAYKHLKADSMSIDDLKFAQNHLWITSFLYGLLRPFDGILPYRMEGNVELPSAEGKNIFGFWKNRLTDKLIGMIKADDGILLHLATEEYQHLFDWKRLSDEICIVQPLFYVRSGDKLKIQAVWAKTCRGAMTRFIIENRITNLSDILSFCYEGFHFDSKFGDQNYPHFIKSDI